MSVPLNLVALGQMRSVSTGIGFCLNDHPDKVFPVYAVGGEIMNYECSLCIIEVKKPKFELSTASLRYPMFKDLRTNVELAGSLGLAMSSDKVSQFDVSGDFKHIKDRGAPFYVLCAAFPFSIYVTYNCVVRSVDDLVENVGYEWIPFQFRNKFVIQYSITRTGARKILDDTRCGVAPVRRSIFLNVQLNSYSIRTVNATETGPTKGGLLFAWEQTDYFLTLHDKVAHTYPLDDVLRSQIYLKFYVDSWRSPDFKNVNYYSSASYSIWSFINHQNQWRPLLAQLDPETTLVAPGDGVGVISEMWKGACVCGDAHVLASSHERVVKESITQTLLRSEGSSNRIFILSYVVDFLSPSDWDYMARSGCPIIVMDFRDRVVENCGDPCILGKGVIGYRISGLVTFVREDRDRVPRTQFSENLLNLKNVLAVSPSYPLDYLLTVSAGTKLFTKTSAMSAYVTQRGGNSVMFKGEDVVPLVNVVSDLLEFLHMEPYFAPIGKRVSKIVRCDLDLMRTFETRTIYVCQKNKQNLLRLAQVPHVVFDPMIYFFCADTQQKDYPFEILLPDLCSKGTLTFAEDLMSAVPTIHVDNTCVVTIKGVRYDLGVLSELNENCVAKTIPWGMVTSELFVLLSSVLSPLQIRHLEVVDTEVKWVLLAKGGASVTPEMIMEYIRKNARATDRGKYPLGKLRKTEWLAKDYTSAIAIGEDRGYWKQNGKYLKLLF